MVTLFTVVDLIVLLLLLVRILRALWKVLPQGLGSIILTVLVACPLIAFATVSFTVYVGFVTDYSSMLARGIAFIFLLGMLALLRVTWSSQPSGVS